MYRHLEIHDLTDATKNKNWIKILCCKLRKDRQSGGCVCDIHNRKLEIKLLFDNSMKFMTKREIS